MSALSSVQSRVRVFTLCMWSLLLLLIAEQQLLAAFTLTHLGWTLIYSLPLLAPLPGLIRSNRYTYSWATLCVLPYFIVGITESVANAALHTWALALLATSLLWFFGLIAYLRVSRTVQLST